MTRIEMPSLELPNMAKLPALYKQLYGSWVADNVALQVQTLLTPTNPKTGNAFVDNGTNYGIVGKLRLAGPAKITAIYYTNGDIENNAIALFIDGQPVQWSKLIGVIDQSGAFPSGYLSIGRILTQLYTSSVNAVQNVRLGYADLTGNPAAPQGSAAGNSATNYYGAAALFYELKAQYEIAVALDTVNTTSTTTPEVTLLGLPYVTVQYELLL